MMITVKGKILRFRSELIKSTSALSIDGAAVLRIYEIANYPHYEGILDAMVKNSEVFYALYEFSDNKNILVNDENIEFYKDNNAFIDINISFKEIQRNWLIESQMSKHLLLAEKGDMFLAKISIFKKEQIALHDFFSFMN